MSDGDRDRKGADTRADGIADEVGGKVRGAAGALTGDNSQQAKGKFQELKGKAKQKVGKAQQKTEDDRP